MAAWLLHKHPVYIRYKASTCSKATIFVLCCIIITFVTPLLIAFRSHGMWRKTDVYREQAEIHFKNKLIVVLEIKECLNLTSEKNSSCIAAFNFLTWSTLLNYNHLLQDRLRSSYVKFREEDFNRDGKFDALHLSITVPLKENEEVYSVKVLLLFDYRLHEVCRLRMESLAYVDYSAAIPGHHFHVLGDLHFKQRVPVKYLFKEKTENPIINEASLSIKDYTISSILEQYHKKNVSTVLKNVYPVWSGGKGSSFEVKVTITYPEEIIVYLPSFFEQLKWAWIQYFAILIIFITIFNFLKSFVFYNQVLPSITEVPWKIHLR